MDILTADQHLVTDMPGDLELLDLKGKTVEGPWGTVPWRPLKRQEREMRRQGTELTASCTYKNKTKGNNGNLISCILFTIAVTEKSILARICPTCSRVSVGNLELSNRSLRLCPRMPAARA